MTALIQTWALTVDAYRELSARRLFWVTLALNALVIVVFGSLGISEKGVSFWNWTFRDTELIGAIATPELFYKAQFVSWGIPFLSWASTVLALISTAGMIPEMIAEGAIETTLSKPIGRVRLFLTKYALGLLFVALQVLVFSAGCFGVIWLRGKSLTPELFLAVPIVVLFFSYLFCVTALVGLLTRSTIAALLVTVLFWVTLFGVNLADTLLIGQREGTMLRAEDAKRQVDRQVEEADEQLRARAERGEPVVDGEGNVIEDLERQREAMVFSLAGSRARLAEREEAVETWQLWSRRVTALKTVLPKTQETIGQLEKQLITQEDLAAIIGGREDEPRRPPGDAPAFADPRAAPRIEAALRGRTTGWVIGTSLVFEAVVLTICAVMFARRDF